MKSLKDYIAETETKQVTEGILDWAKKIFTPKDPTKQTPITAADIDVGLKDPKFVLQVQSAAAALNISPEQLVAQLKQQVGPASAPAAPAAPAVPAPAAPAVPAPAPGAVAESAEHDSGSTFDHICKTFKRDVKDFQTTGELSEHLFDALYDYYFDDMPYGTKKARDGDPYEWIGNQFFKDLGGQSDTGIAEMVDDDEEPWHGIKDPEMLQYLIGDAKVMDYDDFRDTHSSLLDDPYEFWENYHDDGIAEMVRLAGLPTVQDEGIEDIPAFMRKGKPEVFPAPIMPQPYTKIKHSPVRPENIPAVNRSGPVSLDQIRDNSDKMSDLQTLRRMAGLPDRPEHGSPL